MNSDQYLDALLSLPRILGGQVSPDERWVAWTALGLGEGADVYAAPTDATSPPIRLTETAELTLLVSWTTDSKAVLVQQDHHGDERYRLYRIELDAPGNMKPLTDESPQYFLRGGQLHPNRKWLVYGMNFDVKRNTETEYTWVYRHDLESGERVPLARPQKPTYLLPQMNYPGTHIFYTRKDLDPSGEQVWLVDIEGQEDREVLNFGADRKVSASWLQDGQRAIFLAETETHSRVGLWDMKSSAQRWLIDDKSRNIEWAFVPYGSNKAVIIEVKDAGVRASFLDLESGEETILPQVPGNLMPIAPASNGDWVGTYWSTQQPLDIVRFSPDDLDAEKFTSISRVWDMTSLRREDLTAAQPFRWNSVDGREIAGWLYRSSGEARGTVVYVHGGPTSHSESRINAEIQYYVSQGFNVLDPNYRGSTGYSMEFRESIKEDGWGGREQDDIRTGIEALIKEGIAEPGKVGMTGTSYGGYSSWCGITRWDPEVLAASAPVCGMTDLVVDYETTRPDLRPYSEEMIGGRPDEVPDRYRERSPINFVQDIRGKLLIVQGLQDPNVSPENVRTVEEALKKAGIEYEVQTFDNEGHGIYRPKNRKVLYQRLVSFFSNAFGAG